MGVGEDEGEFDMVMVIVIAYIVVSIAIGAVAAVISDQKGAADADMIGLMVALYWPFLFVLLTVLAPFAAATWVSRRFPHGD